MSDLERLACSGMEGVYIFIYDIFFTPHKTLIPEVLRPNKFRKKGLNSQVFRNLGLNSLTFRKYGTVAYEFFGIGDFRNG